MIATVTVMAYHVLSTKLPATENAIVLTTHVAIDARDVVLRSISIPGGKARERPGSLITQRLVNVRICDDLMFSIFLFLVPIVSWKGV